MLNYTRDDNGKICVEVKKTIYTLKSIFRAAYTFSDYCYIGIDENERYYLVYLTSKNARFIDDKIVGDFQNELLHQRIRLAVEEETRQIRELIVTRALYSAFIPEGIGGEKTEPEEKGEAKALDLDEIAKAWYDEKIEIEQ